MINGFPPSSPQSGPASGSSTGSSSGSSPNSPATGITSSFASLTGDGVAGTPSHDVHSDANGQTQSQNPALAAWAAFADALKAAQTAVPPADLAPTAPSSSLPGVASTTATAQPLGENAATNLDSRIALAPVSPAPSSALASSALSPTAPTAPMSPADAPASDLPHPASKPTDSASGVSLTLSSHANAGPNAPAASLGRGDAAAASPEPTTGAKTIVVRTAALPALSAPSPSLQSNTPASSAATTPTHLSTSHAVSGDAPTPLQSSTPASSSGTVLSEEASLVAPRSTTLTAATAPEAVRITPAESLNSAAPALSIDGATRVENPSNTGLFSTAATTPTPHSAPPTQQWLQADVARQIAHALRQQARDDQTLTLQLRPEHLGKVEVAVTFRDGQISMQLSADTGQTRDLLRQSLQDLKQSLSDGGLDAGDLDVANHAPRDFPHGANQDRTTQKNTTTGNLGNVDALEDTGLRAPLLASASTEPLSDGSLDVHV